MNPEKLYTHPVKMEPMRPWSDEEILAWNRLLDLADRKLNQQIARLDIPIEPSLPNQDVVTVCRLPDPPRKERLGRFYIPDAYQDKHQEAPYSFGVFLWGGPEAMDTLADQGIFPGDTIRFARFAGDEESAGRVTDAIKQVVSATQSGDIEAAAEALEAGDKDRERKKLLRVRVGEVLDSVELFERVNSPEPVLRLVREYRVVGGQMETIHRFRPVPEHILK